MRFLNGVWLEDSDRRPMGKPEISVEFPGDITLGLYVRSPFGPGTDAMVAIHASEDASIPGGTITLAITSQIDLDIAPAKPMNMNLLSNPRRRPEKWET